MWWWHSRQRLVLWLLWQNEELVATAVISWPYNLVLWLPAWGYITLSAHLPLAATLDHIKAIHPRRRQESEWAASKVAGRQMEGSGARMPGWEYEQQGVHVVTGGCQEPLDSWEDQIWTLVHNDGEQHLTWVLRSPTIVLVQDCAIPEWTIHTHILSTFPKPSVFKQVNWTHGYLVGVLLSDQSHIFYSLFCGKEEQSRNTLLFLFFISGTLMYGCTGSLKHQNDSSQWRTVIRWVILI